MNHSYQWAELREVCLVIAHELWPLTLCTYSWAVLKGLTLQLRKWEAEGQMIINKHLWGQDMWKDIWIYLQEPESVLTVLHVPAQRAPTPLATRKLML